MRTLGGQRNDDLGRLLDESRLLRERLRRITAALLLTEDRVADTFERMAARGDEHTEVYTLTAKRARASADECRAFNERLTEFEPD